MVLNDRALPKSTKSSCLVNTGCLTRRVAAAAVQVSQNFCSRTPVASFPFAWRVFVESAESLYELKHDGFRALAYIGGDRCRFVSRRGNGMKRFADLAALIGKQLKVKDAVLYGEIVALDGTGKPAFTIS